MASRSLIAGCRGHELSAEESAFFAAVKPVGLILFQRNCQDKAQVSTLIRSFREAVSSDMVFILIDQEGGRVARLKPPDWRRFPAARHLGKFYEENAELGLKIAGLVTQLLAAELFELGINVDCLPVLDIPVPGAHDIIGDRAYGRTPDTVITLGRAVSNALLTGGVLPVIKHIPGHGRANADSHMSLPIIDADRHTLEQTDFLPFKALYNMPLAMTAHVLIPSLDENRPVSTSTQIISSIVRDHIGFDGALICDDISMEALQGSLAGRARQVLAAGCDLVLHCSGNLKEMEAVAEEVPDLAGDAERRVKAAFARLQLPADFDKIEAKQKLNEILAAGP